MDKKERVSIIISCIDHRFWPQAAALFKKRFGEFDLISMAGAVKNLSSPVEKIYKQVMLGNIGAAIMLHNPYRIVLTSHLDCGAYGGSKKFKNEKKEIAFHLKELKKAKELTRKKFPKLKIFTHILKLEKGGKLKII